MTSDHSALIWVAVQSFFCELHLIECKTPRDPYLLRCSSEVFLFQEETLGFWYQLALKDTVVAFWVVSGDREGRVELLNVAVRLLAQIWEVLVSTCFWLFAWKLTRSTCPCMMCIKSFNMQYVTSIWGDRLSISGHHITRLWKQNIIYVVRKYMSIKFKHRFLTTSNVCIILFIIWKNVEGGNEEITKDLQVILWTILSKSKSYYKVNKLKNDLSVLN